MAEHVDIDLPLSPRHASTVRAVAASVGADVGLSVDQIDDLRLGVNEAISILTDVDVPEGVDARLLVRFDIAANAVEATVRREGIHEPVGALDVLATRILSAVVDEFDIDDGGVVTVVKRIVGDVVEY